MRGRGHTEGGDTRPAVSVHKPSRAGFTGNRFARPLAVGQRKPGQVIGTALEFGRQPSWPDGEVSRLGGAAGGRHMGYVCDVPEGKTWFRIVTEAEPVMESQEMRHAIEKHFRICREAGAESVQNTLTGFFGR